ncbi:glycosyltransferase [Saccharolobus islandicus]|uniref:glycosyltransferase n=1 Tax=Saccharolobus islandicus TaxID=43080 RepID=UPI0003741E88|nr:glycosyltransferase [Sulfolobus islandicus]
MLITIVTYNPDVNFVGNMIKMIKNKDKDYKVLVIDNHSRLQVEELRELADYFIQFDKNYGLGRAYNHAIKFAKELKEKYVMFLDQDTTILDSFNPNKVIKEAEELKQIDTVILSINIDNALIREEIPNSNFYIAKGIFNSGMILNRSYAEKNPFFEDLFLDRLDHEFIYRAKKLGYLPLVYREKMILHKPGENLNEFHSLCGKILTNVSLLLYGKNSNKKEYKYYRYYTNFLRYYLMLRNDIYLWLRRKIYTNYWKIIIADILIMCEVLGYKKSMKWSLRAIKYGISGDLDKDNKELFEK